MALCSASAAMPDFTVSHLLVAEFSIPIGWCHWAINVGLDESQYQQKYSNWPVGFHGTKKAENVHEFKFVFKIIY